MKTSIFSRILLASLLPMVLVFSLVIFVINNVVFTNAANEAKETTDLVARQVSRQIALKLANLSTLTHLISENFSDIDFTATGGRYWADEILAKLLTSDKALNCARFAFEPGIFDPDRFYYKTLLQRENGGALAIVDLTPDKLRNPGVSPWYNLPLSTGNRYINITDHYDYDREEEVASAVTMAYPIFKGSRPIGVISLGIRYKSLFDASDFQMDLTRGERIMLVSAEGRILYSENPENEGLTLLSHSSIKPELMAEALRQGAAFSEEGFSPFINSQALTALYPILVEDAGQTIFLYMVVPSEHIYNMARSSTRLILSVSVLGLLLLALSVFLATRNIVRPVKQLTYNFNKVANGDLDITYEAEELRRRSNVRELEILQTSLHKMLGQITRAHDMSLKSAREKLEREKLLTAAQAKSAFFAHMSHEIRTPMNAILGISEIMLHDGRLTERQRKYIQDIRISSDSLLTIINDILDLSKMESGKMVLIPVNFNFKALLDNISSLALYLASEKGLNFKMETGGEIPDFLFCDDVRLRQILLNVISNAVKFTIEGTINFCVIAEPSSLLFIIADTGVGIKPEDLPILFDPFKQADIVKNRGIMGTGLGLSICKNLVQLMGGSITLDSVYGQGSTFFITVPKITGEALETAQPASIKKCFRRSAQILIVDDNEINLNVASGLLKALYGLDSDLAESGSKALEMVQLKDYDLIFMDHMMPEMNGVEAAARIRAMGEKYRNIPIIALTANAVAGTRESLMEAGLNDFLAKPIRKNELEEILRKWIAEESSPGLETDTAITPSDELNLVLAKARMINEINIAVGLESVANQQDIYKQLLKLLAGKIPLVTRILNDLILAGNLPELHIHVHGMKSSLASVGALDLSGLALDLEKAALDNNLPFCRQNLPIFIKRLTKLGDRLNGLFCDSKEAETKPMGDPAELALDLARLAEALNQYDYEDINLNLNKIMAKSYEAAINEILLEIKRRTDGFDYKGAVSLLKSSFDMDA